VVGDLATLMSMNHRDPTPRTRLQEATHVSSQKRRNTKREQEVQAKARRALVVVLVLSVTAVTLLSRDAGMAGVLSPGPTPTIPDLLGESPSPSPTPSPTSSPDQEKRGEKESRSRRDRGRHPTRRQGSPEKVRIDGKHQAERRHGFGKSFFRYDGVWYGTDRLLGYLARLAWLGDPIRNPQRHAFRPFVLAGDATWTNTWGAPRVDPGGRKRRHEGQDIFCDAGTPILASERGVIEFDTNALGGRIARLYRADGSFWYYAHLSHWNTDELRSRARVKAGAVIGYCGDTGNAEGGLPHLHFGWYTRNGVANDPLPKLAGWLREAEQSARERLIRLQRRIRNRRKSLETERRFGDAFIPDLESIHLVFEDGSPVGSFMQRMLLGPLRPLLFAQGPVLLESGQAVTHSNGRAKIEQAQAAWAIWGDHDALRGLDSLSTHMVAWVLIEGR
jgi:murein DD-endopeptidase MepM/ murein hydrolase activator NlpD